MAGSDRAINMALRVLGIGEVERDFKRVGAAGTRSFAEIDKAANGSAREVSEYTARLKRAAAEAKLAFANMQEAHRGSPQQVAQNRRDFIIGRVEGEKDRIRAGLPDLTQGLGESAAAADGMAMSLGQVAAIGTAAGLAIGAITKFAFDSVSAFQEHEQALSAFNATLNLTGNRSNAAATDIQSMALAIADASDQTEASVLSAAASLAKIPGMTKDSMQAALEGAAQLADALGVEVTQVIEDRYGPALKALADRDLPALDKATEDLDDRLRLLVVSLAASGDTAGAQRALIEGLAAAAGDGPGSLTESTNRASKAWDNLKIAFGENFAGPAADAMDWLAGKLKAFSVEAQGARFSWLQLLKDVAYDDGSNRVWGMRRSAAPGPIAGQDKVDTTYNNALLGELNAMSSAKAAAEYKRRFGYLSDRPGRKRGGGGGKSDADRAAEQAKREAEQARNAADRISEANADVVESYRRRASEAQAKIGLEGAALEAVERQQEIEAAARRINTDLIEKEVEARRKAAAAAGKQFDVAAATRDATAAVQGQQAEVRRLAGEYIDAEKAIADFSQRQQEAKAILEEVKTPIEKINDAVERSIALLRAGSLSTEGFEKRMDQLARAMAEANIEADKGKRAWVGFGNDVGRTLTDLVVNGGSARDVLQELIRMPLERLLFQTVEQPIAAQIDSWLGVNVDKNAAEISAGLKSNATTSLDGLAASAEAAAQALARMTGTEGSWGASAFANDNATAEQTAMTADQIGALGTASRQVGDAMHQLVPNIGQFGGALAQLISTLSAGGGGGGGFGAFLQMGASLLGGGGAGPLASLVPDAAATIAANPALFASGTDRVPVGQPFWVGENGRELMELTRGGGLMVHSNQQSHRMVDGGGGGFHNTQIINIPERADPRRTAAGIARSTQSAIARSARKGLASAGN